jgi:hypothetical protein
MPNNEFPILDGIAPSWADIIVRATPSGGPLVEMRDIAAINTGRSLEVGIQEGVTGGRPKARTSGKAGFEASITFYRSGYDLFIEALSLLAPNVRGNEYAISLVHFGIEIQHTPFGSSRIFHRRLKGCRVMGDTMNSAEGTDAQQVECPLSVIVIADVVGGREIVLV